MRTNFLSKTITRYFNFNTLTYAPFLILVLCLQLIAASGFAQSGIEREGFLSVENPKIILVDHVATTLNVPVKMGGPGLNAVSNFQLFITFDAAKLSFSGIIAGVLSNVVANSQGNLITLNWSNPAGPINLLNSATLVQLQFNRIAAGSVLLEFQPGSKVGNNQNLLAMQYVNGMVLQTWQLQLNVAPTNAGQATGSGEYFPGQNINLQAIANTGYQFLNWTKDGTILSTNPVYSYTMPNANATVVANFTPISYQVTTNNSPATGGTSSGSGIYNFGQNVSTIASPATGYSFLNWTLNSQVVATTATYNFTMPASNLSLWANFQQNNYTLSLSSSPAIGGTTNGGGSFVYNAPVTAVAIPATGYQFVNWTLNGQVVSTNSSYSFQMPASNHSLVANFQQIEYTLTLQVTPSASGTTLGSGTYFYNTGVTVVATPAIGYQFVNWTLNGQVVSTNATYSFSMPAANQTLVANFVLSNYILTLEVNPAASGTTSGAGSYHYNDPVTVQANANTGYHFVGWTLNSVIVSTSTTYTFNMPATNHNLIARFEINSYTIQVQANNPDYGSVSGGGTFQHNTLVTLNALPNEDFVFVAWTENSQTVSFLQQYSFNALANRNLTAVFQEILPCPHPLDLSVSALSETTATLHWVSAAQITEWEVLWGLAEFDTLQAGNLVSDLTQNTYVLEELSAQTSYDFYVRSVCGENNLSDWEGPLRFSTHYVGLQPINESSDFDIYPNPAKDKITIRSNTSAVQNILYEIINNQGVVILSSNMQFDKNFTIDLHEIPNGVYTLRLTMNTKSVTKKLIVSK